jgi:DNA glycosylase AlkZ-like
MSEVFSARFRSQLLSGPKPRDPLTVVERLLAVQGQDPRGARLAIRVRSRELVAADVDRALTQDRSLLITWLNRGTLHLVRSEDYRWLHPLTTPGLLAWNARRLDQERVPPDAAERAVRVIVRALSSEGPLSRDQLRERVAAAGIRTEGQAIVHTIALASFRGLIVRGPVVGAQHCYVLVRDWLGDPPAFDRDRALAELGRRYLAAHGPADARDLAKWTGLGLGESRAAFRAIGSEIVERPDGLVELPGADPAEAELPGPSLLGPFDPILHGWHSRAEIVGEFAGVVTSNGVFRATALVDGRVAGLWRIRSGKVEIDPLGQLDAATMEALVEDGRDVTRFLAASAGAMPGLEASP